jgi:hypothetical protein
VHPSGIYDRIEQSLEDDEEVDGYEDGERVVGAAHALDKRLVGAQAVVADEGEQEGSWHEADDVRAEDQEGRVDGLDQMKGGYMRHVVSSEKY